jgi:hypothetical protein
MPSKNSRRLVVDASVARSSGDEHATYPTSKRCRDFLLAILDISHQAVMTTEIHNEWNKHQSGFARRWRVSMVARRKLCIVEAPLNKGLRAKIRQAAIRKRDRKVMLNDTHLIEAAIATDRIIISLDETVRILFSEATRNVGELRVIVWANPDKAEENCISWLRDGAKAERDRKLGFGR